MGTEPEPLPQLELLALSALCATVLSTMASRGRAPLPLLSSASPEKVLSQK
jgi:hypothetical protein